VALVALAAGALPAAFAAKTAKPLTVRAATGQITAGVTIGGVPVGGLTADQATSAVNTAYTTGLLGFAIGPRVYHPPVAYFVVHLGLKPALAAALAATAPAAIAVNVHYAASHVNAIANAYAKRATRRALDAAWGFHRDTAVISLPVWGVTITAARLKAAVIAELTNPATRTVTLPLSALRPAVTLRTIGPAIVIRRGDNQLRLFVVRRGHALLARTFRVATGRSQYPTPAGIFSIVDKQRAPWWYPPASSWAQGLKPVPPGPGNPLGTRWMGLSAAGVGIHGTPDAASIGYSASHGCIRMRIPDAEWLFNQVRIGTPVRIV
jgi:lipoprotein-anchoring transpeptidase ErfK/SrfK